jgi:hypothetical protein
MEWTIPLQKLEVSKVLVGKIIYGQKPLVPLSYSDGQIHFPSLSLLLPQAVVKVYDPQTGRLDISLASETQAIQKFRSLQNTILAAVNNQQYAWFNQESRPLEQLQKLFQPMIENDILHLYCPVTVQEKRSASVDTIAVFHEDTFTQGVKPSDIKAGDTIRIALRIQGISFHTHPSYGQWTGKLRLQHKIISLFIKDS